MAKAFDQFMTQSDNCIIFFLTLDQQPVVQYMAQQNQVAQPGG